MLDIFITSSKKWPKNYGTRRLKVSFQQFLWSNGIGDGLAFGLINLQCTTSQSGDQ
jgi:hypothetical protein